MNLTRVSYFFFKFCERIRIVGQIPRWYAPT
jgi:hypothetical protein